MTIDPSEEEAFIFDQYLGALHAYDLQKDKVRLERAKLDDLRDSLEEAKQAFADFMVGNGLKSTDIADNRITLSKAYRVEIEDIDAVPSEYTRQRVTVEANKTLIKDKRPQGNWYTIQETPKLTIRSIF